MLVDGPGSSLTALQTTRVLSNQAIQGGGLAVADRGLAVIRNSEVVGNEARGDGGGFHLSGAAELRMTASEVAANQIGEPGRLRRAGRWDLRRCRRRRIRGHILHHRERCSCVETRVQRGGGFFVGSAVQLTMNSSSVTGNVAFRGGGLYANSSDPSLRPRIDISNSNLEGNAAYLTGGAIDSRSAIDLKLKCVTVSSNTARGLNGGGLHLGGDCQCRCHRCATRRVGDLGQRRRARRWRNLVRGQAWNSAITNSIVSRNQAVQRGGGMYVASGIDAIGINRSAVELSLIAGNTAGDSNQPGMNAAGGGVWAGRGANVTITATTIDGNSALASGGGLAVDRAGSFLLRDSTVSRNRGVNGGGAAVLGSAATFLQTTWTGNRASQNGGGLFVFADDVAPAVQVQHSTISRNTAAGDIDGRGGGIFLGNAPTIRPESRWTTPLSPEISTRRSISTTRSSRDRLRPVSRGFPHVTVCFVTMPERRCYRGIRMPTAT